MAVKVLSEDDLFTVLMVLIIFSLLALLNQMFIHLLNFDDLLTFPTGNKHWTFFPIMNVNWFNIKTWIVTTTETANLFIRHLLWILLLFIDWVFVAVIIIIITFTFCRIVLLLTNWLLFSTSLSPLRINIRCDVYFHILLHLLFYLLLLRLIMLLKISLLNRTFNSLNLRRSQIGKTFFNFVSHRSVELNHTFYGYLSNILELMLYSDKCKF